MASTMYFESLPYIDPPAPPSTLEKAKALIASETANLLPTTPQPQDSKPTSTPQHPSIPPTVQSPWYTPAMTQEDARVTTKQKLTAIDLSRYKAQNLEAILSATTAPSTTATPADQAAHLTALHSAVKTSQTLLTYLSLKSRTLSTLNTHGKTAWLLSNYHLESELSSLEAALAETKKDIDTTNLARQQLQQGVAEEIRLLERDWRAGVGRVLEAEVEVERVRRVGDEVRRKGTRGDGGVKEAEEL